MRDDEKNCRNTSTIRNDRITHTQADDKIQKHDNVARTEKKRKESQNVHRNHIVVTLDTDLRWRKKK